MPVDGVDELVAKLSRLEGGVSAGMGKVVFAGALTLSGIVKRSMNSGSHSGRTYRRGKKIHIASAPGEAPAIDYGNLVNSISAQLLSTGQQAVAEVSTNSEAGPMLELGTAKMAARPFFRPAVDEHEDEIMDAATMALKKLIEDSI